MDHTHATATVVEFGVRLGWIMRAAQLAAWAVFFLAWLQIGRGDWLYQKIRNSYIRYWGGWILAAYAVVLLNTCLGHFGKVANFLVWAYYPDLLTHLAFSLLAGVVLWWLRVWPAGDAKLFFLLSACYPLMSLPGSFHGGLRFLEVLINIFIPAMMVLFLLSLDYIYRTRFANQKIFLRELGLRREAAFLVEKSRDLLIAILPSILAFYRRLRDAARRAGQAVRARGLRAVLDFLKNPGEAVENLFDWILSVVMMTLVTYWVGDVVASMFLKSLMMFGMFFIWSRLQVYIGRRVMMLAGTAIIFAALAFSENVDWSKFTESFRNITVFSLCIRLGMEWTMRVVAGRLALVFIGLGGIAALPAVEYILEPIVNALLLPALQFVVNLIPWSALAQLGLFEKFSKAMEVWGESAASVHWDVSSVFLRWAITGTVVSWALMGLFFGLALVFARIWDIESYESVDAADIEPRVMPGPKLLETLREDEEFYEEYFDSLYADGLTEEQADALKDWCKEHDVASVPLAPTMSFASWVFVGYLLTVLCDGHVFAFLYGS